MRINKILLLAAIALIFAASYTAGLWDFLTFEYYRTNRDRLLEAVNAGYALSSVIFVALYIAVTALSIPGAAILTLTGGYLFGYAGILHVNIGATAGATAAFLAARYIAGDALQDKYAGKLVKLNSEIDANGKNYMLTLRFIFLFPFFLLNILAGLTKIPLRTFIWTTSIGILPGSFAYIYAGRQVTEINSPGDIISFRMMLAFLLLTAVAIIPVFAKKLIKRRKK